jgi:hypothetical protein
LRRVRTDRDEGGDDVEQVSVKGRGIYGGGGEGFMKQMGKITGVSVASTR